MARPPRQPGADRPPIGATRRQEPDCAAGCRRGVDARRGLRGQERILDIATGHDETMRFAERWPTFLEGERALDDDWREWAAGDGGEIKDRPR